MTLGDSVLDGDDVPEAPNELVAVTDAVVVADCVGMDDGVDDGGRTNCGTGATPRNTTPAAAVATTAVAAVDGT